MNLSLKRRLLEARISLLLICEVAGTGIGSLNGDRQQKDNLIGYGEKVMLQEDILLLRWQGRYKDSRPYSGVQGRGNPGRVKGAHQ